MSKEYKELVSRINIEISAEGKKSARSYLCRINVIAFVVLAMLVGSLIGIRADNRMQWLLLLIPAYILLIVRKMMVKSYFLGLHKIAIDKCNPKMALEEYMYILSRVWYTRWNYHYYFVASMLTNMGRYEDAFRVLKIYEERCPKTEDELFREYVYVVISSVRNDTQGIEEHYEKLEMAYSRTGRDGKYINIYEQAVNAMRIFEVRQRGNYYDMVKAYEEIDFETTNPAKVSRNYVLYKLALDNGLTEDAIRHRDYVIANGGTMWQRAAILNKEE